ncbi:uncharacterized protein MAM_04051 [Metarhizium album ARSEF 1941]|uniref:tRNA splicing endonuclease subunit n=1 Tax=Metarhizium album (strain ARSEF 1941) TaxID=1081103 RepID=A0A0B2WZP1_METAS|nr:uncharacterized protein MAM_04051 [Metarhizium album ARSEF 1941]KHN98290.1 hypothetical protein MAM_04051 [Metarhizium album ARSEF 1941]
MLRRLNGNKNRQEDNEGDSELSDPDSNVAFNDLEDEIVVRGQTSRGAPRMPSRSQTSEVNEDEAMEGAPEESAASHYPKRKRSSVFNDLSESKLESAHTTAPERSPTSPTSTNKLKPNRQSLSGTGSKGVLLGTWRDSRVPDEDKKHSVFGFIDIRDRLRTRIQPITKHGEPVGDDYPLPPGPGASWVTFERVVFSDHLVGLDHFQIKEYCRLRSEAAPEETEDGRVAAEHAAVQEAIRRVRENPALTSALQPPPIAYGVDMPEHLQPPVRPEYKRRRVGSGYAAISPAPPEMASEPAAIPTPQQSIAAHQSRFSIDPLPGTRPTRILIGYWKPSSEDDPKDRHAVYGILGQNDMFRVKVVRETRDGRFVDGNFPAGAGALWIPYEEVEFEPHLKTLNRQEIKEYCRVRQYQLDRGETSAERIDNETKAVYEAQTRAGTMPYKQLHNITVPTFTASPQTDSDERMNGRHEYGGHELRPSRRTEPRPLRASLSEAELRASRLQGGEAVERTNTLARREIARAEAAQGRADRHAMHRERAAAAAAADAANAAAAAAAAASNMPLEHHPNPNGRMLFHETEDMQRLNKVWARQETLRMKSSLDDAKIYDGVKYERRATGPFMGKLVSQGTIINIEGEDYVEYRVLTKPSFF